MQGREFYFWFWVRPYPALAAAAPLGGRCRLQNHPRGFLPSSRWVFSLHPGYLGGLRAEERGQIQQMGQIRAKGGLFLPDPLPFVFFRHPGWCFSYGPGVPGSLQSSAGGSQGSAGKACRGAGDAARSPSARAGRGCPLGTLTLAASSSRTIFSLCLRCCSLFPRSLFLLLSFPVGGKNALASFSLSLCVCVYFFSFTFFFLFIFF